MHFSVNNKSNYVYSIVLVVQRQTGLKTIEKLLESHPAHKVRLLLILSYHAKLIVSGW